MRQPAWQPPCAWPSQRSPSRWTALRMRYMPVEPMVSHSFTASLSTRNRRPQNCSISGMNGSDSSSALASRVARISASLRTSTMSPTRKLSAWPTGTSSVCTATPCLLGRGVPGRWLASSPRRRGRPCPRDRAQHHLGGRLRAQGHVGPWGMGRPAQTNSDTPLGNGAAAGRRAARSAGSRGGRPMWRLILPATDR